MNIRTTQPYRAVPTSNEETHQTKTTNRSTHRLQLNTSLDMTARAAMQRIAQMTHHTIVSAKETIVNHTQRVLSIGTTQQHTGRAQTHAMTTAAMLDKNHQNHS